MREKSSELQAENKTYKEINTKLLTLNTFEENFKLPQLLVKLLKI